MTLDTDKFLLLTDGKETSVEPQVFNLIVYLIENKNKVVTRDNILDEIWKGRVVSDTSINNHIKSARKVLGDNGTKQQVIKTIHSRGYQFIAKVGTNAESLSHTQTVTESNSIINKDVTAQKLIAVLPFANTKPNIKTDYLSFALANQIISDLAYLEEYTIRPAGSIRKYIAQIIDPIAIGKELEVDYIISGYYLLENKVVRLNVEMIEINNNQLVWREQMQVNFSDTFSLQDRVAQKVAKALDVEFRQNFLNQEHRNIPNSALAFEYYLRGISYPQSNEGHKLAVEMLLKSIELDPKFAPSYAHLGFHLRLLEQHGRIVHHELNDSEWYYQKALELNPILLDALSNLSALYAETNRTEDALLISRRMLEINPNDANSHFAIGYIYRYAGMLDEAILEMEKALSISPNNSRFRSIISTYVSTGRYDDALAKVYLDSGDYGTGYSGMIAFEQKQNDLAKELFTQVIEIDESGIWGLIAQVYLAVMSGNKDLGLIALSKMVDSSITDAENMYYFSHFYALLKEKDLSLQWLEKAVITGYFNYPHISRNAAFIFLKHDSRFNAILNRAKQRHQAFKKKFL